MPMNKIEKLIKDLCPNGVEWKKLGEVCTIVRGASPRPIQKFLTKEENGVAWIKIGDATPGSKFITSCEEKITKEGSLKSRLVHKGDFILSNSMSFGRPFILGIDGCIHDGWIAMSDFEKIALPDYFYYMLLTEPVQNYWAMKANSGGAVSNLNADIVRSTPIPIPSLPIQTEIVRILDKFVEQQEQLERLIELRKKQYEYYTHKLYSDLKQKGVNIKRLGDFCDLLSGNPFDSNLMVNDGIRLMRGMNIKRGSLDFSEDLNKYWKTDDGLEKYYLNRDDIVISMDGSLVGRSFAYIEEKHLPLLLVQRVARIRTNKNNSKYLYHYLANGYFAEHVDLKKTAGAIPHISMKDISSFQIPLPDIETQNAIVKTLDSFETSIATLTSALEASKNRYEYYRDEMMRF